MSQQESKDFSVSKVAQYDSRHSVNMKNSMAVLNYNTEWQNVISEFRGGMEFLLRTESVIEKKLINLDSVPENRKKQIRLDPVNLYRIKQVWTGGTFVTRERDSNFHNSYIKNSELFHYDTSTIDKNNPNLEIIPQPALDNMTPIGRIRDPTLLIQISQSVPMYLAFQGMDYDTLIREGGLYHMANGKMIAKFSPEEQNSKIRKTYKVGRDYYHKTMNILKTKFLENWRPLSVDLHQLILFAEQQEIDLEDLIMQGLGNKGQDEVDVDESQRDYDFEEE